MSVLGKFGVPVAGSHQTLMPKLQYRFRVLFGNMGGASNNNIVTRQVISVTRPQLTHDEMILDVYNSRIYLAGKHTWAPVTVILRDEVQSHTIKALDQQLQNQLHHYDQSAAKAGANYKFYMEIQTLDGDDDPTGDSILDHWYLAGCYISDIAYGDSSYGNSDQQQVTCTIRYDNAQHGKGSYTASGADAYLNHATIGTVGGDNATGSVVTSST
jgi:hypothetical protein